LVYGGGLWAGLPLGNRIKVVALQPTFQLLRKLSPTLVAFAAGYVAIVIVFSTFYAFVWRVGKEDSFGGLTDSPTMPTFMYFSLVTVTTIGYGDIVPKSALARSLAGLQSITALGWTLVVFPVLSLRFAEASHADASRAEPPQGLPRSPSPSEEGSRGPEKEH
jgi:hypothetical protein